MTQAELHYRKMTQTPVEKLIMRLSIAHIAPAFIGEWGLYLAEVMAWVGADLVLLPSYFYRARRLDRLSE